MAHRTLISADQLAGEGQWGSVQQQLNYPEDYYVQVNIMAEQAWRRLPSSGLKTEELSKIRQGPDEPYQDFVSQLLQAMGRLVVDGEAGMISVKQLTFENANAAYPMAIHPYRKRGNLTDYIQIYADIGPSYLQELAMAAAMKEMTLPQLWKAIQQNGW
jgi:hypothetical protein